MSAQVARRPLQYLILYISLAVAPWAAVAAEPDPVVDELVSQIIALRGEVDALDSRLQGLRKDHRDRMSSLAREEGNLASEAERQQLRLKKIEQTLAQQREGLATAGVGDEELIPVLRDAIAGLRTHVESALPFKRVERLAALKEIEAQLEGGSLPPPRIANRLWAFVADEVRLAGETGLYRQAITVDGQEKLVDVARLGMMQLYFRTDDGRVGYAGDSGDGWRFHYAEGGDRDRIETFMGALRQQIRTGYFELPNHRLAPRSSVETR